jgi:hypothetical protein
MDIDRCSGGIGVVFGSLFHRYVPVLVMGPQRVFERQSFAPASQDSSTRRHNQLTDRKGCHAPH